jgi:hypothetical protein
MTEKKSLIPTSKAKNAYDLCLEVIDLTHETRSGCDQGLIFWSVVYRPAAGHAGAYR